MKINQPGIYRGISDTDYRSDPCPTPSLTQSLCKILIERAPKHAWTQNPRLNPQFEPDDDTKFDLGNIAHRLILGRGKDIEVLPPQFMDWRKGTAQELREAATKRGCIAVLKHQYDQAVEMVAASWSQLGKHEDKDAFTGGDAEVMIAWQENGIWFRSLIDWLHSDLRIVDDYKSTAMSVAPHVIGMRAEAGGWHIQAAFIERGLDLLDPEGAGRRRYRFIAQETDKPYALTSMHMSEFWMTMGRKKVEAAIALWKPALEHNYWRDYGTRAVIPDYPGFKEKQWLERELNGEFEPDHKLIMAG